MEITWRHRHLKVGSLGFLRVCLLPGVSIGMGCFLELSLDSDVPSWGVVSPLLSIHSQCTVSSLAQVGLEPRLSHRLDWQNSCATLWCLPHASCSQLSCLPSRFVKIDEIMGVVSEPVGQGLWNASFWAKWTKLRLLHSPAVDWFFLGESIGLSVCCSL